MVKAPMVSAQMFYEKDWIINERLTQIEEYLTREAVHFNSRPLKGGALYAAVTEAILEKLDGGSPYLSNLKFEGDVGALTYPKQVPNEAASYFDHAITRIIMETITDTPDEADFLSELDEKFAKMRDQLSMAIAAIRKIEAANVSAIKAHEGSLQVK